MHQIHFLLGTAPDPAGGAYSAPRPLPLFKGPTSKGMEGNGREEEKVKGKEGERWREVWCGAPMGRAPRDGQQAPLPLASWSGARRARPGQSPAKF